MEETIMKIKYLHHPKSMLAIAVALAVQTAAAANVDNINLLAVTLRPEATVLSLLIIMTHSPFLTQKILRVTGITSVHYVLETLAPDQ